MTLKPPVIYLSVVVPFYNEADVCGQFHDALMQTLEPLDRSCEIIYVDDGSTDQTAYILKASSANSSIPVSIIEFRKNFGQTAGLQAGFDYAQGDIVIAMDGDLQHDPSEIPQFIEKIEEGFDLVSGWREKRIDSFWIRRLPSLFANKMMHVLTGIQLHDFGTTFKAYRKEILNDIKLYGDMHRFIPVLAFQSGAKICELPIKNVPRQYGKSKYGLSRTTRVLFDIFTMSFFLSYSTRPMHFWGRLGLISTTVGSLVVSYIITDYLVSGSDLRGTLQIGVMFIVLGIQLFGIGLILEFLSRVHYESTDKKIYAVRDIHKSG
jgi:glycosyltransferase involved in cell wall biosynthesis